MRQTLREGPDRMAPASRSSRCLAAPFTAIDFDLVWPRIIGGDNYNLMALPCPGFGHGRFRLAGVLYVQTSWKARGNPDRSWREN